MFSTTEPAKCVHVYTPSNYAFTQGFSAIGVSEESLERLRLFLLTNCCA